MNDLFGLGFAASLARRRPAVPRLPRGPLGYGDRAELAALFTGCVVLGKDGSGDHILAEVHPRRAPEFRLVAATGLLVPQGRRSSASEVLERYARATWLLKLLVGLPFAYEHRPRAAARPMDELHDFLETLITSPRAPRLPSAPALVQTFLPAARTHGALWRRRFSANQRAAKRRLASATETPDGAGALHEALSSLGTSSETVERLRRRFASQPTDTSTLEELAYELWNLKAWTPMLRVAELALRIEDSGYYMRLQKGLALLQLDRLDEALVALVDARTWNSTDANVASAIKAVRERKKEARR